MADILVLTKRIGNLFNEVLDISSQLAEAVDRRDEVSMNMIIAMRSEPIEKLLIADNALREQLDKLDQEEGQRIRAILNGEESLASDPMEAALAAQAALNIRTHKRVVELDEVLSKKIGRDKSAYR